MNRLFACLSVLVLAASAQAKPSVLPLFSDHMVLQRGASVPVFGQADPGEAITVVLTHGTKQIAAQKITANPQGKWRVDLDTTQAPNTAMELTISGQSQIKINDVLVGQVWLCSGQSNMQWVVNHSQNAQQEMSQADFPQIRHFSVPFTSIYQPSSELNGRWEVTTPRSVGNFTAVGYFFGRELHQKLQVPVGLINSSVGGTAAESWASDQSLDSFDEFRPQREQNKLVAQNMDTAYEKYRSDMKLWEAKLPLLPERELAAKYSAVDCDISTWTAVTLPRQIEATDPDFDGSIWYRRDFTLDAAQGKATLHLGRIDDHDITYINGQRVGGIGNESDSAWATVRRYEIPAGVLKPGRNVISIRVFDTWLAGGFTDSPESLYIQVDGKAHSLAGQWQSKIEHRLDPDQKAIAAQRPGNPKQSVNVTSTLYNGMIHPLQPYAIAGAIWYQGEANVNRHDQYRKLLPAMIQGWREAWNQKSAPVIHAEAGRDFPFYIVQLANYMEYRRDPNFPSMWAHIRQVQAETAASLTHCGLAVTIDIGDERDIHPKNKQDVGKRLAAVALHDAYGHDIPCAGPTFSKLTVSGSRALVSFDHVGKGLQIRSLEIPSAGNQPNVYRELVSAASPVKGFAVCDKDGKWFWATATIKDSKTIEVHSDKVVQPTAVRYGWADNPVVNLYNDAGFPAVPFEAKP